jgi:hypothetical protein
LVSSLPILAIGIQLVADRSSIARWFPGQRIAAPRIMPRVALRIDVGGQEETLAEYICDWPDCPNVAVEVVGAIRELRRMAVVCAEHAARLNGRAANEPRDGVN